MTGILLTFPIQLVVMSFYIFGPNKGPVFFKQVRIGKYGQEFYIYKFRSMVVDAEKKLRENEELHQKYIKNNYKLEQDEDPRITSFGRFIRKTSLDELPQFINVLKGDMSLVGPRPVVLEELDEYKNRKEVFLSVKPGITGYWQVCGRSDVGYPDRVDIELYYAYNQSLWLDIKIMLKTILLVILRKGAY
ncbi:sugar transferase [Bacillus sp. ISL-75]|nr:sugar transferase [Bacillus sp. ISL-75]